MTRTELISALAGRTPDLKYNDVSRSLAIIVNAITERLAVGGRVEIRDFGSFSVTTRPARTSRNPRTGIPVYVSTKRVVRFKAGTDLRERVDKAVHQEMLNKF